MVGRSYFEVLKSDSGVYELYSAKFARNFDLTISFIEVKELEEGDLIEMPDSMIFYEEGGRRFVNHQLNFGMPDSTVAIPKGFDIEEDYAYISYNKDSSKVKVQRLYG